ncbi:MerR family transcriptional regulator [bacterium]|nr:MerR family transcriptional regulator [bacterium]
MYSISEVTKITNLTARTLRHYEEKGLITSTRNGTSGYRHYSKQELKKIEEIKRFKKMEFSLEEIKSFLDCNEEQLQSSLIGKLNKKIGNIDTEIDRLQTSKKEAQTQLLATTNFFNGKVLKKDQRRVLMETIKKEILDQLKLKKNVGHKELEYLKREDYLFDSPEKREFIEGVKKCLAFAKSENIKIGPARGASPALLSLYAIGWSDFDPSEFNLVPERFSATDFDLHVDVEFKNGKKFIDYCKRISNDLTIGKIEAFKLPIIDIIKNTEDAIGKKINYESIDNNDSLILDQFRKGDIKNIFSFDIPKNTLVAKHFDSNYYKDGSATKMMSEYLKSQEIHDFKDLLNIEAIFRPDNLDTKPFMREFIDRYPKAKKEGHYYDCLSSSLNEFLKPNYGVIIYQEDVIQIIREYTSWEYEKCNQFRKDLSKETITEEQKIELLEHLHKDVLDLLVKESPVVFCKAHSVGAWPNLIKKTAILKALHKDIYLEEQKKWEALNGYSWGDFGFISGGLSLLQQ